MVRVPHIRFIEKSIRTIAHGVPNIRIKGLLHHAVGSGKAILPQNGTKRAVPPETNPAVL